MTGSQIALANGLADPWNGALQLPISTTNPGFLLERILSIIVKVDHAKGIFYPRGLLYSRFG